MAYLILREKIGQCLFLLEEKAFFEKSCSKKFFTTEIFYLISATLSVKMPSGAKQFFPWRLSYSIIRGKKWRNLLYPKWKLFRIVCFKQLLRPFRNKLSTCTKILKKTLWAVIDCFMRSAFFCSMGKRKSKSLFSQGKGFSWTIFLSIS